VNLPVFHNRIMLISKTYTQNSKWAILKQIVFTFIIFSREGLQEFVRGLLQGLGKLYGTVVIVELIQSRRQSSHEVFK
jgi:hypothetical protein